MIYISTGNYKNHKPEQLLPYFNKNKIKNIELSGGEYQSNIFNFLKINSNRFNLQIHNYFPPPKKPIVINLASNNREVIKDSITLIKNSIDLAKIVGSKYYSFHAGFLVDLTPKDLGKSKKKLKKISKKIGLSNFLKNVKKISEYAKKKKIEILIENNVIGSSNFKIFKGNPFLMTDLLDIKYIMKNTPKNVNLLLDLGHLKVSANTLGFDKFKTHEESKEWIKAYHISENNGKEDTNSPIKSSSWFKNKLKKVNSYTLEVYTKDLKIIKKQVTILKKISDAK
jgi:sugar phosphate isomerase/epimerase